MITLLLEAFARGVLIGLGELPTPTRPRRRRPRLRLVLGGAA